MDTQPMSCSSSYSSSSFKLFGVTISCDRGCNHRKKDCTSESLFSSITFPTSTSLKRKKRDSPPVQSSVPSLSLSLSLGESVSKPTILIRSEKKKKTNSAAPLRLDKKEQAVISRLQISLELSLFHDPWKIRKNLYKSDLGSHCRLLISRKDAIAHIMFFMDRESKEEIESNDGMDVIMVDMDTGTEHNLVLRYLASMEGYVLRKGWRTEFVKRRELKEGDEVGLRWDICSRKFYFSVLHRHRTTYPPPKC